MSTQTEQQPLTDEEIRAIRKRVEMATPEPWRACTWDPMVHPHVHKDYLDQRTCSGQYDIPLTKEDAIFIAHAREDVPRLLDEIERLRAIETQAIEQSEYVQREWLSPSEATGLKREVERLRADLNRFREWAEVGRWIPVTERLPSDEVVVNVAYRIGDSRTRTSLAYRKRGIWTHACDEIEESMERQIGDMMIRVTHWMPLPAPPTQKQDDVQS